VWGPGATTDPNVGRRLGERWWRCLDFASFVASATIIAVGPATPGVDGGGRRSPVTGERRLSRTVPPLCWVHDALPRFPSGDAPDVVVGCCEWFPAARERDMLSALNAG
jgi:hypothetical protein